MPLRRRRPDSAARVPVALGGATDHRADVVIDREPAGPTTLHVSWNGATEVVRWQVLAGRRAAQLRPVLTVARSGFETVVPVPGRPAYVAVAAVDRKGVVLRTSKPQRV